MENSGAHPIVVDLDHTLLMTDSLHEQIIHACFTNPVALLVCGLELRHGRAAFKAALAAKFPLEFQLVPLREPFLAWLTARHEAGAVLHLCTAAHQSIANKIAARVGLFTDVIGSETVNLKSESKAAHLEKLFPGGFVYAGDSRADLAVWRRSSGIILVGAAPSVEVAVRALGKPVEAVFARETYQFMDWVRAIRMHQWSKNALVFLPLLLGHYWDNFPAMRSVCLGFLVLLLMISATYLINDLSDLASDRAHWSKRHRPIASGRITVFSAFAAGIISIFIALVLGFLIAPGFGVGLLCYLAITLGYSFGLKQVPLLDTFIIAFLFTLRLIMGASLAGQPYSEWLLAFSMVFFFSLATAKRHTELLRTIQKGGASTRGYRAEDTVVTAVFGISSGVSSLTILALYFAEDSFQHSLYRHPMFLWVIPLLVGVLLGRIWLLAQRGEMRDDPVKFVIGDKVSLGLGVLTAIAFCCAL